MSTDKLDGVAAGVLGTVLIVALMWLMYEVGYTDGRQSMPVATEPRCEIVMERGKVVKLTCPDSTGRMP